VSSDRTSQPAAEPLLQAILESVRDYAIFLLDADGKVATWNAGARAIKKYEPEEIIGQHFSRFYTSADVANGKPQRLLQAAKENGRVEDEGWRVRKDGSHFWADVVITAVTGPDKQLRGFVKVTRDLTGRHEAELALRRSEASLSATLTSIGDGVIATDTEGRVTRLNPVAAKLCGWSQTDAVGQPIEKVFEIVNEYTRLPAQNPVARVLAEGIVVGLANHTSLLARDGRETPIADSGAPIRDPSGTMLGAVLVFRDVGAERAAEAALRASEERLRLMIASIRDYAVFMLDPEGHVATWNPGAEAIKGYRADEIIGRHFSIFYPETDIRAGKPERELVTAAAVGRFEDEDWRLRKDGSRFWGNVVISAIRNDSGELIGFTKVTRDMTDRRMAAAQLLGAERLAELEREKTLRAEAALRERDVFLSVAAHELRTPLTALQLKLQGLEQLVNKGRAKPELSDRANQRFKDALRQTARLGELVERLLDVSRIAAGRLALELESLDLDELVKDVIDGFDDKSTDGRAEIRTHLSGNAHGVWDRRRLEQMLANLLSNALKYGEGHPIDVRVDADASHVTLTVLDRGIGIQATDLERIFKPFERAAPVEHYAGLGLGLHIARHIVEAHGGTIEVSSQPGSGAKFVVTLPKAASGRSSSSPPNEDHA